MRAKDNAPIIIKRKKVIAGGGHHGGAWKVAYADFVTAMMAFFMLMWLLNATTETQRKGLADYFSPTIPVNRISGGGDGAFGGDSVFAEESLAQNGTGGSANNPGEAAAVSESSGADSSGQDKGSDDQAFADIESVLAAQSGESMVSMMMQRHIITKVTDEGLIVELFDLPDEPLFSMVPRNRPRSWPIWWRCWHRCLALLPIRSPSAVTCAPIRWFTGPIRSGHCQIRAPTRSGRCSPGNNWPRIASKE